MTAGRSTSRRHFLKFASGAVALPTAGSLLLTASTNAAGAGQLDEADPAAAALGYKKDTAQVDAARYPQHQPSQICAKCRYFQAKSTAEWGPCTIFAGKGAVHSNGWCAAYATR
jgi:hypothetical protein